MNSTEVFIWSACTGIYLSYFLLSCFYTLYNRNVQGLQTSGFILLTACFFVSGSGLAEHFFPSLGKIWHGQAFMLSACLAAIVSAYGLRGFLQAQLRDALIDRGMLTLMLIDALQLIWLLEPVPRSLEWMSLILSTSAVASFWLCLRAWLIGDRFALPMSVASAAAVFGISGIFATALQLTPNAFPFQAGAAACMALFVVIASHTLKARNVEFLRMRRALTMSRDRDLLTQLWTGAALIRKVDESVARARRNRKDMAVIYVEITNIATLRQQFGNNGLEQVIYGMAARIRHASGSSTSAVGRYSDNSFVVVLDSVQRPSVLRTLGLRLAVSARRPFLLNPFSSSPSEFRADVGVGVARISPGREATGHARKSESIQMGVFDSFSLAQDVLHEAAELALSARAFASRAAIVDAYSRKTVALEKADLK